MESSWVETVSNACDVMIDVLSKDIHRRHQGAKPLFT
jgi:hypothetical protein